LRNCPSAEEKTDELDERLKTSIRDHLQSLEIKFQQYFPELTEEVAALV